MEKKKNQRWLGWVLNIVTFLLFFWPVYIVLIYSIFGANLRIVVSVMYMGVATILGAICVKYNFGRKPVISRWKWIVLIIFSLLFYSAFLISAVYFLVFQNL
jgi:hypothetical protein